jgi:Cell division protein
MRGSNFSYLLKSGLSNVWKNRLMSFASVCILAACLLLTAFTYLLTINFTSIVGTVEQQNDIVIFAADQATESDLEKLQIDLEKNEYISDIKYISKEQAVEEQIERLGGNELFPDLAEDNYLPASFRVKLKSLAELEAATASFMALPNVLKVNAPTNIAKTLTGIHGAINIFGIAVIITLIIISLVIISNTIRASVFVRKNEIGIMKHVGATNRYIRFPFIVEGVVIGTVAAAVTYLIVWLSYDKIINMLQDNASDFMLTMYTGLIPFGKIGISLGIFFILAGVAVGTIGSALSISKHLKV